MPMHELQQITTTDVLLALWPLWLLIAATLIGAFLPGPKG